MTYQETLDYLYSQLPMFTRIGSAAIKKDLTNTLALCKALGQPQEKFKCIHIAGTNGKGSSSHMLASILQEAGYKTGLYTSPHLKDFRERIRINGEMISEEKVIGFVGSNQNLFEEIRPSFFEWTVALCFDYFAEEKVDIAIIETGLGGRLDSTNIIDPILSIITNIGWDHMDMLGDSLEKIAFEKAGIIKTKTPVVIGEYQSETFPIFMEKARKTESQIILATQLVNILYFNSSISQSAFDVQFQFGEYWKNVYCDLNGLYQEKNIKTVLASLDIIRNAGFKIEEKDVRNGLAHVKKNTQLMGRWQLLGIQPMVVCDTGHNIDGIKLVLKQIAMQKYSHLHMVIGMVKDKDIQKVLSILPKDATYYFTKAAIPRALDEKELQGFAIAYQLKGKTYETVIEAVDAAKQTAKKSDLIFIGGSTFVVAEAV
ncbi:MAG: bifunctional folylpolyglutamate synthase/dihydrofolate synthase [Bacteroidia bacterium]|nr:bifunctional folylpolyglutamate synthase/dihydrofolate synthase [Bacteroidia bacterium]MCF8426036.1 bifunctional folylpolyglutamate synthase/dihydrofolate synthase [Bacteroidia bacterium]MCF8445369.1 bifunctional folylpolyglutamate synthase/dihydrofolate synthase [Bacteroidia bacterium]